MCLDKPVDCQRAFLHDSTPVPPNLLLIPSDAKAAFVRVADAYEQLRHSASQRQALLALRKPSHAKPPHKGGAAAGAASSTRPQKPRSFMNVLREWEEFEREFFEREAQSQRVTERQHRAEKKVSRIGPRIMILSSLGQSIDE